MLVIAVLVVVIMTLLGLSFMLTGEMESKIARNQRDAAQAGFIAEGGVRIVKKWFDAPSGARSHLVPGPAQMDRTLRWVDDNNDGTYDPYASANPPFNVIYRPVHVSTPPPSSLRERLFEKPYRGTPGQMLLGTEDNPDIRISEAGSTGERDFLRDLNQDLYGTFPAASQRARIRQIDVYGPPILVVAGQRVRYGMGTVKVTADVYQHAGTANETRIATRIVKAVLNETPYSGPGGPLQSCVDINAAGEFMPHWGVVTAVNVLNVPSNLNEKAFSSVPFYDLNPYRIIARDMNQDGALQLGSPGNPTPDDRDANGTYDFDQWIASPDMEDPWLKYWSEGEVVAGGKAISPGCTGPSCQPAPWARPNAAPPPDWTFQPGDVDHSNLLKNVPRSLCPEYDYAFWKDVSLSGTENVYYYKYAPGGYRLFGQGPVVTFEDAIGRTNRSGIFFFDTIDSSPPRDANNDGTYENLAPSVSLSGSSDSISAGGFIYLNANFRTTGQGQVQPAYRRDLIAPGEPFIDSNGNGLYDPDEWFVDIDYANSPDPSNPQGKFRKRGMGRVADGDIRQDPAQSPPGPGSGRYPDRQINFMGVFFIQGAFDAQGNWVFFGSVVTKSGMTLGAGNPDFFFDERLIKEEWPPLDLGLPRTVISAWQTDL